MRTQELVRGQQLARLGGSAVGKSRVNINRETQHKKALNLSRGCRAGFLVESVSSARQHRPG
ncbi:MAG: hypothetical protein D6743_10450 [Calditrichaeota bacterium]|nr:MAG: hypothetical protein D6743_10450 [Calditrichota bacterium]